MWTYFLLSVQANSWQKHLNFKPTVSSNKASSDNLVFTKSSLFFVYKMSDSIIQFPVKWLILAQFRHLAKLEMNLNFSGEFRPYLLSSFLEVWKLTYFLVQEANFLENILCNSSKYMKYAFISHQVLRINVYCDLFAPEKKLWYNRVVSNFSN